MLRLLSDHRFRLLWLSGALTMMSHIVFGMVHGWLTLTVTDSPLWVGVVAGMAGVSLLAFSMPGGVLADRVDRVKIVASSELGLVLIWALLALSILSGREVALWHLLVVSVIFGASSAIRLPAFMALFVDVVGRDRLFSANAANFASFGAAGIVAPLLAGAVVARWDIGWSYVGMSGISLVSLLVLLRLRAPTPSGRADLPLKPRESPWRSLVEAFTHLLSSPLVRVLILTQVVVEAFGWAHLPMLPVMARDFLDAGPQGLGYLVAAGHAGFLCSNLVLSSLGDIRHKNRLLLVGYGGFGLMLMLFSTSRSFPLSLLLLAAAYAVVGLYESNLHTMVQLAVPDGMRGRIASFQTMTWGIAGGSGFHTGAIARWLGAPAAVAVGGAVVFLNAVRLTPTLWRADEAPDATPR